MTDTGEWVLCPVCSRKTRIKVNKDTEVRAFPLYCHRCLQTSVVDIKNMIVTVKQTKIL